MRAIPSIGDPISTRDSSWSYGTNYPNVIADVSTMPEDGWITRITAETGGYRGPVQARMCLWQDDDGKLLFAGPQETWQYGLAPHGADVPNIRMGRGQSFFRGFWRPQSDWVWWGLNHKPGLEQYHLLETHSGVPSRYAGYLTQPDYSLVGLTHYVANAAPLKGSFYTAPSGTVGNLNPLFEGTLPHPSSEGGRDHTDVVHVRIFDVTAGRMVYNQQFENENRPEIFSRRLFQHQSGHDYWADFRHRDSWGVWSGFSSRTYYRTISGPDKPTFPADGTYGAAQPRKKSDIVTGIRYHARYAHPAGVALGAARVEVRSADGSLLLHDSGWRTPNLAPNAAGDFGVDQWHAALPWGVGRTYRVRARDTNGVESGWSALYAFRTNSAPFAPTNPSPAGGDASNATTLRCAVRDFDGDAIQSVVFRVFSGGVQITGSPFTATGPFPSGSSAEVNLSGALTLGTRYEWDAEASDGILSGPRSARESFVYAQVPTVSWAGPQTNLTNVVRQPSAEHDPLNLSAYWAGPAQRIADGDVPETGRTYCWRVPYSGGVDPGVWRGASHAVNATLPAHLSAWLKTELGVPTTHLRLACFDAAGTRLGQVYPTGEAAGGLQGARPDGAWTRYGGFVAASAWPVGTARAAIEVLANSGTGADVGDGAVRFDLFFCVPNLPAGSRVSDPSWYGYFDGDTTGYGAPGDYYWTGAPGDSSSVGRARLTEPLGTTVLVMGYQGSSAKADDSTTIQYWTGSAWVAAYDSGFSGGGGARTVIPAPSSVVQNHGRYRIRLAAIDANGLAGNTGWAEFDAEFAGPEELLVTQVAGNDDEATISIGWQPSRLSPLEFAGIEVSLVEGGKSRTLDVLTNQSALGYVFHFPRSGTEYELRARQLAFLQGEVVEGPWRGGPASVSYERWHVKDILDPGQYNASFVVYADMEPSTDRKGSGTSFRPRHRALPVHYKGPAEQQAGSFEVRILSGKDAEAELEELLTVLGRRYVALLSDRPPRVRYVYLGDPSEAQTDNPWYAAVSVDWEESLYLEDYYAREGPR